MKLSRLFALAVLTVSLYGCGGGGGTVTGNPAVDSLTRGQNELSRVASGAQNADAPTLESIFQLFTDALSTSPNSTTAHFGAAICLAGVVAHEAEGQSSGGGSGSSGGGVVGGSPGQGAEDVPPAPPGEPTTPQAIPPRHTLGLIWNLDRGLSDPLVLLNMLAPVTDLRFGLMPYYGYTQDDVAGRQQMLDRLNKVAEHLAKVEADPNFTYTLPDSDHNGQPVTITLAEVYLFDAYVQTLRVEAALSLAYVRDAGETPPPPPIFTHDGTVSSNDPGFASPINDINHDGKLSPQEYLPPSPFLTLRDASVLQTAKEAMLAVVDKGNKGITLALARTTEGSFLLPNTEAMRAALTRMKDTILPLIQQAANGPVTLEWERPIPMMLIAVAGGSNNPYRPNGSALFAPAIWPGELPPNPPAPQRESLTINLAAWFASPPADLKAFAPTYTLEEHGWPRYDTAVYPDPHFGGLFPNGLPASFRF